LDSSPNKSSQLKVILFCFGYSYELVSQLSKKYTNLKLITFGKSHIELLRKVTSAPLQCIPPLFDSKSFYFDQKSRTATRKKMKVKEGEKVFIYVGRLSLQKNIFLLLKMFKYIISLDNSIKLFIIGSPDSLGEPHKGHYQTPEFIEKINAYIADETKQGNVVFIKNTNQEELNILYNCADASISLSTHHGEILGLSPIEASLTGIPCFLSSWGGYKDYADYHSKGSKYYKVQKNTKLPINLIIKDILKFSTSSNIERNYNSMQIRSKLSKDSPAEVVSSFLDEDIEKINNLSKTKYQFNNLELTPAEYEDLFRSFYV
jgi:glycosyltransferase involved in cell wall biosynthesis